MDRENYDFDVCDDTWEKIQEIESLECHLLSVRRWLEADNDTLSTQIEAVQRAADSARKLFQDLVALQRMLLGNL